MPVPTTYFSPNVVFYQKATQASIAGLQSLQQSCIKWETDFGVSWGSTVDNDDTSNLHSNLERISLLTGTDFQSTQAAVLRMQWNVTWVPLASAWLQSLPATERQYVSYNHLSGTIRTFSWRAVGDLLSTYLRTGTIRIPLACIQGITDLHVRIVSQDTSTLEKGVDHWQITRIDEDLVYALDLQRGALLNRICANDLRLFLEIARNCRSSNSNNTNNSDLKSTNDDVWYDIVATSLPWRNVPGSNYLDVDDTEEGPIAAAVFLGIVTITMSLVASWLAPELLGQSLQWGRPNYIVPPEEVNQILY
jgi:hypothetical protein